MCVILLFELNNYRPCIKYLNFLLQHPPFPDLFHAPDLEFLLGIIYFDANENRSAKSVLQGKLNKYNINTNTITIQLQLQYNTITMQPQYNHNTITITIQYNAINLSYPSDLSIYLSGTSWLARSASPHTPNGGASSSPGSKQRI